MASLSFWEKEHLTRYDYLIIGGGIVGLSTAASLLEKEPQLRVAVIEAGILPTGASTRNAGFACFGSLTEIIDDLNHDSPATVTALVARRYEGLRRLRNRLGDQAIEYEGLGGYELIAPANLSALDRLDEVNQLLEPIFNAPVFRLCTREQINAFEFAGDEIAAMIYNPFEGQLNTGKMIAALQSYVSRLGGVILTGCRVEHIANNPPEIKLKTQSGIILTGKAVAVCTNAFTHRLLPELEVVPGRGHVLITEPLEKPLPFQGAFHFDKGYYYFRNVGNRVLFGGGRNLNFAAETTDSFELNPQIIAALEHKLKTLILPGKTFQISRQWAGIMAFGSTKTPILQQLSPGVYVGVRCGGMGVALGSMVGAELAEMLLLRQ